MADLLERVEADPELSPIKRRDIASAIRRLVKHSGRSMLTEASFPALRGILRQDRATNGHMSPKTLSNIASCVKFALLRYGAQTRAPLKKHLSPDWRDLRDRLPFPAYVRGLSNFIHWCSREGIPPHAVDDRVTAAYLQDLALHSFNRKPQKVYRRVCQLWNKGHAEVPDWPTGSVAVPSFKNTISQPWAAFSDGFRSDLDTYLQVMGGEDLLAVNTPSAPRKRSTLETHRAQIRRLASALVRTGYPIERITGLCDLVRPDNARAALTYYHDRLGGKTPGLFEMASTLVVVAEQYVRLPEPALSELKEFRNRLRCRQRGMTDKNRERVRQFHDPRNQQRFLALTARLIRLSEKSANPRKAALLYQTAVLHEIGINAPLRLQNLAELNLDRHVRFSGSGRRRRAFLAIPSEEVKNREALEFELPAHLVNMLERYLEAHRPRLVSGNDDGWLFPGQKPGRPKTVVQIRHQLCKAVLKHTGLVVNPHVYRHIAAFFYLEQHPEDYETVRRLLGHKSIETTITFYAEFERRSAIRRYNEHLLERRFKLGVT